MRKFAILRPFPLSRSKGAQSALIPVGYLSEYPALYYLMLLNAEFLWKCVSLFSDDDQRQLILQLELFPSETMIYIFSSWRLHIWTSLIGQPRNTFFGPHWIHGFLAFTTWNSFLLCRKVAWKSIIAASLTLDISEFLILPLVTL